MKDYVSFSAWTHYKECEAQALHNEREDLKTPQTEAMLVSAFMEMLLLEPDKEEEFLNENLNVYAYKNPEKGLKKVFSDAKESAELIRSDETFMHFLEGQKQLKLEGVINGVKVLGYADVVSEEMNRIVDLKYVKDFNRAWNPATRRRESFIEQRRYPVQGAIYRELYYQKTGKVLDFYIAAATKETPSKRAIATFVEANYESSLDSFAESLPRIMELRAGTVEPNHCGVCDYCTQNLDAPVLNYRLIGMSPEEIVEYTRFRDLDREEE